MNDSWPDGSNVTSDKAPSEIAYADSATVTEADWPLIMPNAFDTKALRTSLPGNNATVDGSGIRWGFQLRPDEPRLRCVKLFLDPGQQLRAFVSGSEMRTLIAKSGKDAVSVVADYLTQL